MCSFTASRTRTSPSANRERSAPTEISTGPARTIEYNPAKSTTTEDEARITHLHTRNRPCSIALRRYSDHVITVFLAVFSVVVLNRCRRESPILLQSVARELAVVIVLVEGGR